MIMKNLHISMAFIFVLLLITASCSDKDDSAPRVIPTMNLTVSEIADNTALITSEQQQVLHSERKSLISIRWPTSALTITLK